MSTHDNTGRRHPTTRQPTGKKLRVPQGGRLRFLEELSWFADGLPSDHCKHLLAIQGTISGRQQKVCLTDYWNEEPHYLNRPAWQYPPKHLAWPSRHHHIIHQCDDAAIELLKKASRYHDYAKDSHKYHGLMQNIVLAEMRIGASQHRDWTFVPSHRVSPLPNEYEIDLDGKSYKLKPDARYIIDYGGTRRLFFLEVHRGTEDTTGMVSGKKTVEKMIRLYRQFIGRQNNAQAHYQKHFGFHIPAFVQIVCSNEGDAKSILALIDKLTDGKGTNYIGVRCDERFKITDSRREYSAPMVSLDNFTGPYSLAGKREPFFACVPEGFKKTAS